MELKRILARDTRAATEKAIALYGADVLIISNHQIHGETELVVAIDLPEEPAMELQPTDTKSDSQGLSFQAALKQSQNPPEITPMASPTSESNARDYLRSREIVELVREELAGLRREFRLGQQTLPWRTNLNIAPTLQNFVESLNRTQMPQGLLALLLDSLKDLQDPAEALHTLREEMGQVLARQTNTEPTPTQGIHVMAGPSGSGKTLMAARLLHNAFQQNLNHPLEPMDVALISYQDARMGAWSQTQMLAAKLGIDCYRAPTQDVLKVVIQELTQKKLVLIDTPGVQMALRVEEVLAAIPEAQCHAVMPADSSSTSFERVLLKSNLPFKSLFLSKLDEASPPWALLDFLSHNPCVVSGCSTGEHLHNLMPDFSLQHLLDLALLPLAPVAEDIGAASGLEDISLKRAPASVQPPVTLQPATFGWR
jgi:flagellar biosynthesis GTPase FlhF